MKKYIGGAKVSQFNRLMTTPQNFTRRAIRPWSPRLQSLFGYEETSCYLGTWLKDNALSIAEELRKDGFKVKLRTRGSRKKFREENLGLRRYPLGDMPLSYASHVAIYIIGDITEVEEHE
jgi:hypothetical protein